MTRVDINDNNQSSNILQNLKHDRQLHYQEERSITHNMDVFPGKNKDKKPTIIYYVYIMDHETISYKTLIQELSVQYNRLTLSYKNQQIHVLILYLQIAYLLCANPCNGKPTNDLNSSCLGCTFLMGTYTMCVIT
jgi:hypothetical protein